MNPGANVSSSAFVAVVSVRWTTEGEGTEGFVITSEGDLEFEDQRIKTFEEGVETYDPVFCGRNVIIKSMNLGGDANRQLRFLEE